MNVPKIGLIERIFKPKKGLNIKQASVIQKQDEVSISSSALKKFKADERIKEIVQNAPDIRIDKVNEVKEKLKKAEYLQNLNYGDVADKLMKSPFGISLK